MVCAPFFAPNSRFMRLFQAALDTCLGSPFFASLSVHGLHFTVCAPSIITLTTHTPLIKGVEPGLLRTPSCGSPDVGDQAQIILRTVPISRDYLHALVSGVAPANQTKERPVHELFARAFRKKSLRCEFRACFPKEKHQNFHTKLGEIFI